MLRLHKLHIHLHLRRCNSFDARKWIACHVPSTSYPLRSSKALASFQELSIENQNHVFSVASADLKPDFQLSALLSQKAPPSQIFQLIFSNKSHRYATPILEQYLFMLLNAGNMTAATSLLHVLLDRHDYSFSHQMWSFFTSKAISSGHYASTIMVYHELIDPTSQNDAHVTVGSVSHNPHVPFLLLPTAIDALCTIYQQNGNYLFVQGLCDYFERYYFRFGHRSVYQTLCIARVETLSKQKNIGAALKAFNELAANYRGYDRYEDPRKSVQPIMQAANRNHKQTENNIQENLSKSGNPNQEFNPETVTGFTLHDRTYAIFDGTIQKADVPEFYGLLLQGIRSLKQHNSGYIDRLMTLITANHYSINKFLVIGLCELGLGREAVAISSKTLEMIPVGVTRLDSHLFHEQFIAIFNCIRKQLEQSKRPKEIHKLLMESFWLCQSLHYKHFLYTMCLRAFVCAYVASPYGNLDEIKRIIQSHGSYFKQLSLDAVSYKRAISLGIDPYLISNDFGISWRDQ